MAGWEHLHGDEDWIQTDRQAIEEEKYNASEDDGEWEDLIKQKATHKDVEPINWNEIWSKIDNDPSWAA